MNGSVQRTFQSGVTFPRTPLVVGVLLTSLAGVGCGGGRDAVTDSAADTPLTDRTSVREAATIAERWVSDPEPLADLDSPHVWVGENGAGWVIVTAKQGDQLHVLNASDGFELRRIGGPGEMLGQLERPNGIAIWGDLALVVERDNARVQLFSLPDFTSVASFGDELEYPYGIATVEQEDGILTLWVTDDYEVSSTDPDYSRRVHRYSLEGSPETGFNVAHEGTFGSEALGGVDLQVVETIWADEVHGRLLVADEAARLHRVFDFSGTYTGTDVADGMIVGDPEGSALYRCGDGGYWILTDQEDMASHFLVFDRVTLASLGAFRGEVTVKTDGVGLTQADVLGSPGGAFFALHDDKAIGAFAWSDIAAALGLEVCPA